ncbi:bifunctional 4-hydroxy-2-oxoglutarate aldolase/2-dehydro-3-deoxy-phosphogluconate aldolase [Stakelama tenebrarum]|uniref:Bifunctional 4-hydroxy-2-oxoglutarate aldolase/2-dehydro-3-deoxy-phosphogluconate aldolase n=1 Tax=Stakelama tenebrarum TaxID=2711215 RepID=A0A6G6Y710_9SPHN|nr:bifunctional 4-hydroxy-2-oxoglutarate aldolase/2-dehydro-3-deoxy-phosphogluconate aldolase [Sphingosinithalassobacter tenebrarum]QIG80366.1 bifunctional 4-hydroxy-2-oxoglutarate aldolase/2-dehydro-3-deoxy-phosphogluconate aldolase [Sphingosinithalassobacter tenebrarum]
MKPIETIMRTSPVIPVLVIEDAAAARPLAEALVKGGLKVLEVTMRTGAAIEAMAEMKKVDGAIVGAGTVINEAQFRQVADVGAEFIVSPGLTERLAKPILEAEMPLLPGTANASDIMLGLELGLEHFKFFPAEAAGGLKALKALAGPFYQAKFCPTGGISAATAPEWLAFDRVLCVGGSWVTPKGASMEDVERIAREAAGQKG